MYVCVCTAVSDKSVRRAMADGACSLRELKERLGVATHCRRCVPELQSLLATGAAARPAAVCMERASALASTA